VERRNRSGKKTGLWYGAPARTSRGKGLVWSPQFRVGEFRVGGWPSDRLRKGIGFVGRRKWNKRVDREGVAFLGYVSGRVKLGGKKNWRQEAGKFVVYRGEFQWSA